MRQRGLLDRKKRPYLVAAWADDADRPGRDQEHEVAGGGKGQACGSHEEGADDQHTPPPDPNVSPMSNCRTRSRRARSFKAQMTVCCTSAEDHCPNSL